MPARKFQISNFKFQISKRGFTLIELLIVVAIISILVSIGAVSFSQAQRQARDAQRKSDLAKVASALEQYYGDNNAYPDNDASGRIDCGGGGINWGDPFTCAGKTYVANLPTDPSGTQYNYQALHVDGITNCTNAAKDCQRFIVATDLESTTDPDLDPGCLGSYDFCVTNP